MLVITREQVEKLAERDRRDFVGRMSAYIRANFSHLQPAGADLEAWLHDALRRSLSFGIDTEPEAAQLILLYLVLGADAADRLPWVKETLRDRGLVSIGKVRKLLAASRANQIPSIDEVDITSTQEIT